MFYLHARVIAWMAYLTFAKKCSCYNFAQGTLPEGLPDLSTKKAHKGCQVLQNFGTSTPGPKKGKPSRVLKYFHRLCLCWEKTWNLELTF